MSTRFAARLLTGPLAFLIAGVIDIAVLAGRSLLARLGGSRRRPPRFGAHARDRL